MKKNLSASSIVEALVIMLIIMLGVIGVFGILNSSQRLANTTGNRIQAIQIARDGIESMTNIRDTNWVKFPVDYENCWNTLNYDGLCIGGFGQKMTSGSYIIYPTIENQYKLTSKSVAGDITNTSYRNEFQVFTDSNGFYTQSGSTTETKPLFTREIIISYPSTHSMEVVSHVQWIDSSSTKPHSVELRTLITNWQSKKQN